MTGTTEHNTLPNIKAIATESRTYISGLGPISLDGHLNVRHGRISSICCIGAGYVVRLLSPTYTTELTKHSGRSYMRSDR